MNPWKTKPSRAERRPDIRRSDSSAVGASDAYGTDRSSIESSHDVEQGGLARSRRTDDRDHFSRIDAETDARLVALARTGVRLARLAVHDRCDGIELDVVLAGDRRLNPAALVALVEERLPPAQAM